MQKYKYRTITINQKGLGLFSSRKIPDLEKTLNNNGEDGWRMKEIILPSAAFGESDKVVIIFEKQYE